MVPDIPLIVSPNRETVLYLVLDTPVSILSNKERVLQLVRDIPVKELPCAVQVQPRPLAVLQPSSTTAEVFVQLILIFLEDYALSLQSAKQRQ